MSTLCVTCQIISSLKLIFLTLVDFQFPLSSTRQKIRVNIIVPDWSKIKWKVLLIFEKSGVKKNWVFRKSGFHCVVRTVNHIHVVVNFLSQVIVIFPLFQLHQHTLPYPKIWCKKRILLYFYKRPCLLLGWLHLRYTIMWLCDAVMSHTWLSWFDYVTVWCCSSQRPAFHPCSPWSVQ